MKIPLLPLVLAALAAQAFAAPIPADSTITAATVYADRAVVTRLARIDLPAGQSEVTFAGLPVNLLDNSLQVTGRGVPATILDVGARITYIETTADPRVKTLEAELTALQRQDRALQDKLAVLDQQRALLFKIEAAVAQPAPKDATAPRPAFDDWQKLLTFSSENAARLATDRQSLDQQREDLALKTTATQAQLNELRGQRPGRRATKTVTVRVAAPQTGALDVTLAYALTGASWSPSYDARLRTEERAIELTYFGVVRNGTGEDWQKIALTLSTARPNLGGGAPELYPWIVDISRPAAARASASMPRGDMFAEKSNRDQNNAQAFNFVGLEGALGGLPAEQESSVSLAVLDTSATSASFKIPTAASIPSDNSAQKVGIATTKLDANLQYQATPKQLETAFLGAYTTNSTDFPLLAGPVSTFLDNTFVATSRLKTVMPGEKFSLDLGADEGVAIKRKLVNRFSEDTGFTSKTKRVTYEFLITVTNNKRTTERIVFKDVLPTSRDEKIIVKLLAPSEKETGTKDKPGREVTREEDGKLVWRLDLKAGEKREISLKFSVEHPADLTVSGLE
ncbi:mucoidy inhibitor MuiA family protein [Rariglobus hedericola]|uniref:Mucoidy inhibitor MuiA family protein n=1 Tax=Rariglobus hedericola TaxID=2597822 RepID=A0A556QJD1_9BACT|nr:mucoidy inhibitor MuiA family protein [Rariglobus hedericola]TSJ76739.1 mucoidy inhibitor MuiA family protein [Rariglobus hedericola]